MILYIYTYQYVMYIYRAQGTLGGWRGLRLVVAVWSARAVSQRDNGALSLRIDQWLTHRESAISCLHSTGPLDQEGPPDAMDLFTTLHDLQVSTSCHVRSNRDNAVKPQDMLPPQNVPLTA